MEAAEAVAEADSAAVVAEVTVVVAEVTEAAVEVTVAVVVDMVAAAVARVEATAAEAVEAETVATEVPIVTPPGVADRRATGGARLLVVLVGHWFLVSEQLSAVLLGFDLSVYGSRSGYFYVRVMS